MGKKRIHELAKELSMTSTELLQRMAELNIMTGAKLSASHSIEDSMAEDIRRQIASKTQLAAAGVVVRRRKKGSGAAQELESLAEGEIETPAAKPETTDEPVEAAAPASTDSGAAGDGNETPKGSTNSRSSKSTKGFDTATIIGVQTKLPNQDPKGKDKVQSAATQKTPTPDFIRVIPKTVEQSAGPVLVPAPEPVDPVLTEEISSESPTVVSPPEPGPIAVVTEVLSAAAVDTQKSKSDRSRGGQGPIRKVTTEVGSVGRPKDSRNQPINEAARVVGMVKPRADGTKTGAPPRSTGGARVGPQPRSDAPAGGRGPSTAPRTGRPQPPRPGTRPEPAPAPSSGNETRKRGDRSKKKGGPFSERTGTEETSRTNRRRELVERTDLYSEGTWDRTRSKKGKGPKKTQAKTEITIPKAIKRRIKVDEVITVSELAHRLSLKAGDVIKKLMTMGVMAGLNQALDFDTATLVAAEFGYEVEKSAFDEDVFLPISDTAEKYPLEGRSPVVTIMGHVDHGKTSLLDYIRKTKIQEGEAGGITQHIGAYHVKVGQRYITFLDTPGHEAFTAMRSRGAQVTDLVILIVAADDGVMPQTREAADHARAAKVPILVAVNKVDKPGADPERIRRQMMELGLTQEAWGGDTVFVDISAKTGQGVDELLDLILLQADLLELKARTQGPAKGRIIEARLDKGRGAVATVLVGEGLLKQGDPYVCGVFCGKVRALFNDQGQRVEQAGPAIPVEIQGISGVPQAGDEFVVMEDEKQARQVSQHRLLKQRENELVKTSKLTLENLFDHIKAGAVKGLNLIVKADVQGSLEAILDAIGKLSNQEIKITVIHSSTGAVSETDIMLASASNALVICFGVKPPSSKVTDVADSVQVQVRYYDVIYKLLDDIKEAMAGLLDPVKSEKILGQAEVRQVFTITKVGVVAGSYVTDGKVTRGARVRLYRGRESIYDGRVSTLKREKNDVREVLSGYECGINLDNYSDIQVGDRLEFYQIEETAATVELVNEAVERAAEAARVTEAARTAEAEI
ncbi:MAG: translation initiation factor IF-2 [Deltaproteobacteria bacterium]|jgi:translation initiation factor IF-2|nr:translation initiation factor IF-2 [Deltaproteobacteria bacterium]